MWKEIVHYILQASLWNDKNLFTIYIENKYSVLTEDSKLIVRLCLSCLLPVSLTRLLAITLNAFAELDTDMLTFVIRKVLTKLVRRAWQLDRRVWRINQNTAYVICRSPLYGARLKSSDDGCTHQTKHKYKQLYCMYAFDHIAPTR